MISVVNKVIADCRNCGDEIFEHDGEWIHTDGFSRVCYQPVMFAAPDEAVGR